ncbi:MAG: twin-arginine translocation signal domain-containing protein [Planctomycetota bacterium]
MVTKWNRREFLKQGGIAGGGLLLGCRFLCSCSNSQAGM